MPHYVICIREQPAEQGLLLLVSPIHEYVVHIIDPTGSTRSEVVLCQRTLRGCVNVFQPSSTTPKNGRVNPNVPPRHLVLEEVSLIFKAGVCQCQTTQAQCYSMLNLRYLKKGNIEILMILSNC